MLLHSAVKPASPITTTLNPNADVFHSTCQNETVHVELESTSSNHWSESSMSDLAVTNTTSDENSVLENYLRPDQLRTMLRTQLEYYFSRENLAVDTYLVSQMDADQFVPIKTVASFNQVKRITHNIDLIIEVLKESANVQVDEMGEKVRPMHERCIVILREVPDSTPVEEVEQLFSGQSCPKFLSCQFAHNNSWYVTFETEEQAQKAYRHLREEVRTFHGIPIMARIKAKPLLRNVATFAAKETLKPHYDTTVFNAPAKFAYTSSVPSIQYIAPQNLPFFSPHATISPLWSTSIAYFDPGMVFAANGYIPTVAFIAPPAMAQNNITSSRIRTPNNQSLDHGDANDTNSRTRGGNHSTTESASRSSNNEASKLNQRCPSRNLSSRTHTSSSSSAECCKGLDGIVLGLADHRSIPAGGRMSGGVARYSSSCDGTEGRYSRHSRHGPDHTGASSSGSAIQERNFLSNRTGGNKISRRKGRNGISDGAKQSSKESPAVTFHLEESFFPPLPGTSASNEASDNKKSEDARRDDQMNRHRTPHSSMKLTPTRASVVSINPKNCQSQSQQCSVKCDAKCQLSSTYSSLEGTDGQSSGKLSYAQMALRCKERHQESTSNSSTLVVVTPSVDASSCLLREQQTSDVRTPIRAKGSALSGSVGRRASKENRYSAVT